ncbi:DNA-directed RNA polymerase subunit omega [Rhodobacterales bacterium 56_14_T64]|nr:DNA-directed RNA polymerase subunit omega [Rhodobacterales bacterium 56_14_T64]
MVFRRRDRRSPLRAIADFLWPRGGWTRAFHYVKHRVRRLPDSPERIARGIAAGVFTAFTPFYGLHFVVAVLLARLFNGNILAALSGTFFGNPLTYVPIGVASLQTGHWLLGTDFDTEVDHSLIGKFFGVSKDVWNNLLVLVSDREADWHGLQLFYDEVFLPYMIGGVIPGIIAATVCYFLSVPLIRVYQQRRRSKIKAKFKAIKARAHIESGIAIQSVAAKVAPRKAR